MFCSTECLFQENGLLDCGLVEDGKGSGKSKAGGTYIGVGFLAEAGTAGAEHLALGANLAVDLEANCGNVVLVHQQRV